MNNLPKHRPQRRGAQCSRIGCIGLRPALTDVLKFHLLQCIAAHFLYILLWASQRHTASLFSGLIFVPIWMHAAEKRSSAFWRPCWEIATSSSKSFAKSKG